MKSRGTRIARATEPLVGATVSLDLNGRQRCFRTFRQAKRTAVVKRMVSGGTKTAQSVQAGASRGVEGARSQNVVLARERRPLPATWT